MTSVWEQIIIGAVAVNDGVNFMIEDFTFTPAVKRPLFVRNVDSDGEALVRESHYTNAYMEMQVRCISVANGDIEAALKALGGLVDALQGCERIEGGEAVEWIPAGTELSYIAYALTADIEELPITATGDLAGWFLAQPVLKFKLTLRPFLYGEERVALAETESTELMQVVHVGGIKGDVPAEGRLIIRDKALQARRYAEWGQDVVEIESEPPAQDLQIWDEFTSLKTKLTTTATKIAYASPTYHVGSYRAKLRFDSPTATACLFRIRYNVGGGLREALAWSQPEGKESETEALSTFEIDLGEVTFPEPVRGGPTFEIELEGKSAAGEVEINILALSLVPTHRYGVAWDEEAGAGSAWVCVSGGRFEVASDYAMRWESASDYYATVRYRGSNFYLDPDGGAGRINRIAVKLRRANLREEEDLFGSDKQSVEVLVRERYLVPRA